MSKRFDEDVRQERTFRNVGSSSHRVRALCSRLEMSRRRDRFLRGLLLPPSAVMRTLLLLFPTLPRTGRSFFWCDRWSSPRSSFGSGSRTPALNASCTMCIFSASMDPLVVCVCVGCLRLRLVFAEALKTLRFGALAGLLQRYAFS